MKSFFAALALAAASAVFAADAGRPAAPAAPLKGQVLEVTEAASYTYLRLKTKDGETWAAVGRAQVKPGAEVTIEDPMVMLNFESRALNRRFERIVLGTLRGASGAAPAAANPHAAAPHAAPAKPADIGEVKVAKAPGPDGRTVGEVVARRAELKDKPVQVRGKVVKFTGDVLGRNWIHLQDGTGSAADRSNDLLVTTAEPARVGEVVIATGVVRTDKDFGSGYAYKVLVEEAKLSR